MISEPWKKFMKFKNLEYINITLGKLKKNRFYYYL